MAKDVAVRITATDQASPVFRRVGQSAQQMGRDVDTAASSGERGMQRFSRAGVAFGAALGGAVALTSEFARSAAEEEVVFARLGQAIEATGKPLDDYTDRIDAAVKKGEEFSFADDQVAAALAQLTTQTGSADAALENLSLVMDVARARGMSLVDAATLVGKVHEGNIGILSRYGIQVEKGATATEALALLQSRTAGQAEAYAETTQGSLDRARNSFDNLTESIGEHANSITTLIALLPGLQAGYMALGGIIGGIGGMKALAPLLGGAAVVGGAASLAYGYNQDTIGETQTNKFWNEFFKAGSSAMNAVLPGNPYDTAKYDAQMMANEIGSAINLVLRAQGEHQEVVWDRVAALTGTITGEMNNTELTTFVEQAATKAGLTVGQYLMGLAEKNPNFTRDPASGAYMPLGDYGRLVANRAYDPNGAPGSAGAGIAGSLPREPNPGSWTTPRATMDTSKLPSYPSASSGMADYTATKNAAADARATTAALIEQFGAWHTLADGVITAGDALGAFKMAQDGLLEDQVVFSQQQSEYNSQLSALEGAYDILQKRQADGIALTTEEQALLDNYPGYYERLKGGVDDATVSQGLLAGKYAENMEKGDALNRTLADNRDASADMSSAVRDLIAALEGIPGYVKSEIEVAGLETSISGAAGLAGLLNGLDGRNVTTTITNTTRNVIENITPFGAHGLTAFAHGGSAYDPIASRFQNGGTWAIVGEVGPELVKLSRGDQVIPTGASKSRLDKMGGGGMTFTGPITIVANDPRQFADQMRTYVGGR